MTKQIGKIMVTDELFAFAKNLCSRGGKVFLSKMDDDHTGVLPLGGCTNCNGIGDIKIEYVVTALSDAPPAAILGKSNGVNETNPVMGMYLERQKKWAGKKMKTFPCPVCAQDAKRAREFNL